MKLYVMRHGPAEDESPDGTDATRALTTSGRIRVRHVAEALLREGEAPKMIASSPLVRAVQTAEIVHACVKLDASIEIHHALSPRGDAASLVRVAASAGQKRLMVVGHEPDVSILVATLLGAPIQPSIAKAMVIGLRVPVEGDAELRFVLDPKTMTMLDDRRAR
jgi:phosphohistidine phosphatase